MWSVNIGIAIMAAFAAASETNLKGTTQTNQLQNNYVETGKMKDEILTNQAEILSEIPTYRIEILANQTDIVKPNQTTERPSAKTEFKQKVFSENAPQQFETVNQSRSPIANLTQYTLNKTEVHDQNKSPVSEQSNAVPFNNTNDETNSSSNCTGSNLSFYSEPEQLNIATPSGINVFPKIVGGTPANIKMYPYIVQIYSDRNFHCGGSILTKLHVVTAAHCVFDIYSNTVMNPRRLLVHVGSTYLFSNQGRRHPVAAFAVFPDYDTIPHDHDIAILKLRSPVVFNDAVQKATIPPQDYVLPKNVTVIAIGWGTTGDSEENPKASKNLNHVTIRYVDQYTCIRNYAILEKLIFAQFTITDNMICAGEMGIGGKDACQGDSGGPLVNGNVLVGLTSWGAGCAHPFYPGVYTKVSKYTNWIHQMVCL